MYRSGCHRLCHHVSDVPDGGEEPETRTYFQKIRAFSDFALEVPYNPAKIADDMNMILESLSEKETTGLLEQIAHLEEDVTKY